MDKARVLVKTPKVERTTGQQLLVRLNLDNPNAVIWLDLAKKCAIFNFENVRVTRVGFRTALDLTNDYNVVEVCLKVLYNFLKSSFDLIEGHWWLNTEKYFSDNTYTFFNTFFHFEGEYGKQVTSERYAWIPRWGVRYGESFARLPNFEKYGYGDPEEFFRSRQLIKPTSITRDRSKVIYAAQLDECLGDFVAGRFTYGVLGRFTYGVLDKNELVKYCCARVSSQIEAAFTPILMVRSSVMYLATGNSLERELKCLDCLNLMNTSKIKPINNPLVEDAWKLACSNNKVDSQLALTILGF